MCVPGNVESTVELEFYSETIATTIDANWTERNGFQK